MSANREDELKHLAEADAHMADAERGLTNQMTQLEALRLAGQDTATAERDLTAFQETLAVWQDHRASIMRAIEQMGAGRG